MDKSLTEEIRFLTRPEGRISYTVAGDGPLVVAVPGMGDLRSVYRDLVPPLLAAGYRVAVTDLRGHGDSDTTFTTFGDEITAADILALIDELGEPAVVIGNSMAAGAAAWAAAENPDAVPGLVLLGPFLRDRPMPKAMVATLRGLYRVAFARPWGAAAWASYYGSLNKGTKAPWLAEHQADLRASLHEPGRLGQFVGLTLGLNHHVVEARLDEVHAPALAVMGTLDPDFPDPAAEAAWIGDRIGAQVVLVDSAGHYPQSQRPDVVVPAVRDFLAGLRTASGWGGSRA